MGIRFHRSMKLVPGVRLNVSKSGFGVSLGVKGLRYAVGPQGTRITAGIPGTGLSYIKRGSFPKGKTVEVETETTETEIAPEIQAKRAKLAIFLMKFYLFMMALAVVYWAGFCLIGHPILGWGSLIGGWWFFGRPGFWGLRNIEHIKTL